MKYIDGRFLKTCPAVDRERLREKVLLNTDKGEEYVAYAPAGWEIIDYFNHGSQVHVSTVRPRKGNRNRLDGTEGRIYLLKNEHPRSLNGARGALKCEMQVSHIVLKSFPEQKRKYAPKIPNVVEGCYYNSDPVRSYIIEEKSPGEWLTLDYFNSFSRTQQKYILTEFAKSICKLHFSLDPKYMKLSEFNVDRYGLHPFPVERYPHEDEIVRYFSSPKLPLIHYDLAPANVLYDDRTKALTIIDFGRAGISDRRIDFQRIRANWDDKFVCALMDKYRLTVGGIMKKWK